MKNYKMYHYIPFHYENLPPFIPIKIGTAHPGHLVGIYLRLYNAMPHSLYTYEIAVADIGAMKDYILPSVIPNIFACGSPPQFARGWLYPCFIPLSHDIKENHEVVLEVVRNDAYMYPNISGVFIYEK